MSQIRFLSENNKEKVFFLDKNDTVKYENQKRAISVYLESLGFREIMQNYCGFQLKVVPILTDDDKIMFWCGYITTNNYQILSYLKQSFAIHGDWTYDNKSDTIGFDCAHIDDIVFSDNIESLGHVSESQSFKNPSWILERLKECVDSYELN